MGYDTIYKYKILEIHLVFLMLCFIQTENLYNQIYCFFSRHQKIFILILIKFVLIFHDIMRNMRMKK